MDSRTKQTRSLVKEVIHQRHHALLDRRAGGDGRRSVGGAGEVGRRCVVVVVLKDVGELVHEIRRGRIVIEASDKIEQTFSVVDESL